MIPNQSRFGGSMRYLFYQGAITPEGVRNAQALAWAAVADGEPALTLCIVSGGGDVTSGIGLFNYLDMLPIPVYTHAAGPCGSIAVTIFLAGRKRTAAPLSMFTTHQSTFSEGPHAGQRAPNTDLIAEPFKTVANWSDDAVAQRFGAADFNFSPREAKKLGIVDNVVDVKLGSGDALVNVFIPN